ncbi:MAG: outer-membrane lipoprotein carrier protein LolA [Pseudomonadota bacterium]|nr:outer-membrane lipoprotein carrier protein LolA [Pseudomonadota bacterium]MEC8058797.1 outer-membrane lipoprotein carrier protein LolA [Pseudomonadota bacterium]
MVATGASAQGPGAVAETLEPNQTTDAASLMALIEDFDGITAAFGQQIVDSNNQILNESTGRLALQRPNFRWQVDAPFAQVILVQGAKVQIYDPDLEQVTERDLDVGSGTTPLTILLGDTASLPTEFMIYRADEQGQERYFLYPKSASAAFLQVELRFVEAKLGYLGIWDNAGQLTRIRFAELKQGQAIPAERFELQVPEGTDIIRG